MAQREHVAVDKIQISALFGGDTVQVLQFPDVVGGHPAVLPRCRVAVHAAGVIAAEETFQIEFHEIRPFLVFR